MIRNLFFIALFFPCLAFGQEVPSSTFTVKTLKEVFDLALKNSETIAVSEQSVREAEALYRETLGSSLPEFSFRSQTAWQDRPVGSSGARPGRSQTDGMLRFSLTGLSGYRELAALKTAQSALGEQRYQHERAQRLLLSDVAGAFFSFLLAKENVTATLRLTELAERRLSELRERVRVGRTREADAIGQEFQATSLKVQHEESLRQTGAASDFLRFLTKASVVDPVMKDAAALEEEKPLQFYLDRMDARPDIGAAWAARQTAMGKVKIARSEYFPQVDFSANSYLYRPASRENNHWDASITAGVPLWSWGAINASVAQAQAVLNQRDLEWQAVRRKADLEVRNARRDYVSVKKQLELKRQAAQLARRDYELQARDEGRGLVTSLEVLESLNRLNSAELALNRANLELRLALLDIEIASGVKFEEMESLK